jgi:hypothetical protein
MGIFNSKIFNNKVFNTTSQIGGGRARHESGERWGMTRYKGDNSQWKIQQELELKKRLLEQNLAQQKEEELQLAKHNEELQVLEQTRNDELAILDLLSAIDENNKTLLLLQERIALLQKQILTLNNNAAWFVLAAACPFNKIKFA